MRDRGVNDRCCGARIVQPHLEQRPQRHAGVALARLELDGHPTRCNLFEHAKGQKSTPACASCRLRRPPTSVAESTSRRGRMAYRPRGSIWSISPVPPRRPASASAVALTCSRVQPNAAAITGRRSTLRAMTNPASDFTSSPSGLTEARDMPTGVVVSRINQDGRPRPRPRWVPACQASARGVAH